VPERVTKGADPPPWMLYITIYCDKSIILMTFLSWLKLRNQVSTDLPHLGHLRRSGEGRGPGRAERYDMARKMMGQLYWPPG